MSEIKLFQTNGNKVSAIDGKSVAVKRSLQSLIEKHLDIFLGAPAGTRACGNLSTYKL
jgi:hypothetical protein